MKSPAKDLSSPKKTVEEEIEHIILSSHNKKKAFEHLADALMKKIDRAAKENNPHSKQSN